MTGDADRAERPAKGPAWYKVARKVLAVTGAAAGFGYILWMLVQNWSQVQDLRQQWDLRWVGLHFLVVVAFFAGFAPVWRMVIRACRIDASPRAVVVSAYLPNLYKYIPGKLWAVASRVELLASYAPTSRGRAAAATVLGYVMEVLGAAPFLFLVAWMIPGGQFRLVKVVVVLAPGLLLVFFPRTVARGLSWMLRKAGRQPLPENLHFGNLPLILLCYIAYWGVYVVAGAILLRGLGEFSTNQALLSGSVLVAAWLVGFLSLLTPGGIGVREGLMALLLTPLVGPASAAVIPLIGRISWTVGEFLGAGIAVMMLRGSSHKSETLE